jgi:hypothetical protein
MGLIDPDRYRDGRQQVAALSDQGETVANLGEANQIRHSDPVAVSRLSAEVGYAAGSLPGSDDFTWVDGSTGDVSDALKDRTRGDQESLGAQRNSSENGAEWIDWYGRSLNVSRQQVGQGLAINDAGRQRQEDLNRIAAAAGTFPATPDSLAWLQQYQIAQQNALSWQRTGLAMTKEGTEQNSLDTVSFERGLAKDTPPPVRLAQNITIKESSIGSSQDWEKSIRNAKEDPALLLRAASPYFAPQVSTRERAWAYDMSINSIHFAGWQNTMRDRSFLGTQFGIELAGEASTATQKFLGEVGQAGIGHGKAANDLANATTQFLTEQQRVASLQQTQQQLTNQYGAAGDSNAVQVELANQAAMQERTEERLFNIQDEAEKSAGTPQGQAVQTEVERTISTGVRNNVGIMAIVENLEERFPNLNRDKTPPAPGDVEEYNNNRYGGPPPSPPSLEGEIEESRSRSVEQEETLLTTLDDLKQVQYPEAPIGDLPLPPDPGDTPPLERIDPKVTSENLERNVALQRAASTAELVGKGASDVFGWWKKQVDKYLYPFDEDGKDDDPPALGVDDFFSLTDVSGNIEYYNTVKESEGLIPERNQQDFDIANDTVRSQEQQDLSNSQSRILATDALEGIENRANESRKANEATAIQNSVAAQELLNRQEEINKRVFLATQEYNAALANHVNNTATQIAYAQQTAHLAQAELVGILMNSPKYLTPAQDAVVQQISADLMNETPSARLFVLRKILGPEIYDQLVLP